MYKGEMELTGEKLVHRGLWWACSNSDPGQTCYESDTQLSWSPGPD